MTLRPLILSFLILFSFLGKAQESSSSAFSSYNFGLLEQNTSLFQRMNGGAKNGYVRSENLNLSNAANLSFTENTAFDVSLRTKITQIDQSGKIGVNQYTNFLYGGIVLPVQEKKWAIGLSLMPYSQVSYKNTVQKQTSDSLLYKYGFSGQGSVSMCKLSSAYNINFDSTFFISAGIEGQYYFGNILKTKDLNISEGLFFSLYEEDNYALKGVGVEGSVLLLKTFKNESFVSLGATYNPGFKPKVSSQHLSYNYTETVLNVQDTIESYSQTSSSTIPFKYSVGGSASYKGQWTLSFDYEQQTWDSTHLRLDQTKLGDYRRLNAGLAFAFTPSRNKEFRPILAFGYSQTQFPVLVQGKALQASALHLGMSIPLFGKLKSKTIFNFGTEFGSYNQVMSAYQERYVHIYVGIVLSPSTYDKWFKHAKID
jgi:hypothetical protein